jgi:hypothetical protein
VAHEEHGLAPLSAGGPEEVQQGDRILRIQLSRPNVLGPGSKPHMGWSLSFPRLDLR